MTRYRLSRICFELRGILQGGPAESSVERLHR